MTGWVARAIALSIVEYGVLLLAPGAVAQNTIVPDAGPLATNTEVSRAGNVTTIDGGTLAGANLFHSFTRFDLAAGDTARWTTTLTDPRAIANVVNRVTGGTASQIDGTIDSTALPNAAFFFVNPAGIVFGAGARVNVPAVAYFSTAQMLKFDDGAQFSAVTANGSTFSIGALHSFGFLGGSGSIMIQGAPVFLSNINASLSLSAADITVSGAGVEGQGISLAAVGAGETMLGIADPTVANVVATGAIRLDGAVLTAHATSDPALAVLAGSVVLSNGAALIGAANGPRGAGDLVIRADSILLDQGSSIANRNIGRPADPATAAGAYAAGDVVIDVRLLTLRNGSTIATSSSVGDAGDIDITMPDEQGILLLDSSGAPSSITTISGPGTGGMIQIASPLAAISNGGSLLAQGATGGARLFIDSEYFIRSADRSNAISVNGPIVLDSNIYDVSNGTAVPTVEFLDASKVLSGQCAGARSSGEVSHFKAVTVGPHSPASAGSSGSQGSGGGGSTGARCR